MTSAASHRLVTARDLDILGALALYPMTAAQLFAISRTFASPFTGERRLRQRLLLLEGAGRVHRRQYSVADCGIPNYYTLTPLGYRLLNRSDVTAPPKRMFDAVGIARQHHTRSLADFLVHTIVAAAQQGTTFTAYARENTLRLCIDGESLFPDAAFTLVENGVSYRYFVELDAGTERIRSKKDIDSWERKIRLYDEYYERTRERFRVLAVSTKESERSTHILETAAALTKNPRRLMVYAASLPAYLSQSDPLRADCFHDHRGKPAALIPTRLSVLPASSPLMDRASPPRTLRTLPTRAFG